MEQQIEDFTSFFENCGKDNLYGMYANTFDNIVVIGMGGSAMAGDIVQAINNKYDYIYVNRGYNIPEHFFNNKNTKTLFVACSYSGNTEETLSCVDQILKNNKNNENLELITICSKSETSKLYNLSLDHKLKMLNVKPGYQPRAALPMMFLKLYSLIDGHDLSEIQTKLDTLKPIIKELANDISSKIVSSNKFPIIYTDNEKMPFIGTRFRNQLNENSKLLAMSNQFPELCHNEIVGYNNKQLIYGINIIIKDIDYHEKNEWRIEICKKFFESRFGNVLEIEAPPHLEYIERIFYLILLIDYVSLYVALKTEQDPVAVDNIDYLKTELAVINNQLF